MNTLLPVTDTLYTLRPARPDDLPGVHRLLHAIAAQQPNSYAPALKDVQADYGDPWCDAEFDSRLAVTSDAGVVAYARCLVNPEPVGAITGYLDCDVHPDHRTDALEEPLLDWLEARATQRVRALAAARPGFAPLELQTRCWDTERDRIARLERRGFRPVRYFYRMRRDLRQPIPDQPLPPGLMLCGYSAELDERIYQAFEESFRDHWHHEPFTRSDWQNFLIQHSTFRPDLSLAVLDGDEVAAISMNRFDAGEAARTGYRAGWISMLGTRRPWRKRGLASALLAASMRAFIAAGLDYAGLGVDAASPTGALRLYEQVGFAPYLRSVALGKTIDD